MLPKNVKFFELNIKTFPYIGFARYRYVPPGDAASSSPGTKPFGVVIVFIAKLLLLGR